MKVSWNGELRKAPPKDTCSSRMGTEDCQYMFETFLNAYFLDATSHHRGNDTPFTANFYHTQRLPSYGAVLEIPTGPPVRGAFTEFCCAGYPPMLEEGSPNIKLVCQDEFLGILCPETQTLWATDWTHDRSYRSCTRHIIMYLVEQGIIWPAPTKTTKPKEEKVEKSTEKIEFAITIGGDPEFELVDGDGDVLRAGDEERIEIYGSCGDVGLDGSCDQVELRPSPGSPETVVNNMRSLLEKFGDKYSHKFRLAASSDEYPCGGHIHIGVTPLPDNTYYSTLSKVLDDFVGYPTKKLNGCCRGTGGDYGRIGDWRNQDYGMEYRTPPSAVWKNPELTSVVLKLAYNLAQILANNLQMEYDTPVIFDDLVTVGGLLPEEATFYMDECQKRAPRSDECLLAAWGIKVEPPKQKPKSKPRISVDFQGEWNRAVIRIFNSFMDEIEVSKSISISCYGLKESRGDVFTFEMPGKEIIEHPQSRELDATYFGFSKKFRGGGINVSDIRDAVASITKVIVGIQNWTIPLRAVREPELVEETDFTVNMSQAEMLENFGINLSR